MSVEDGGAAGASTEVAPTAFTDVMSATFQQAVADGVPPAKHLLRQRLLARRSLLKWVSLLQMCSKLGDCTSYL